MADDLNKSFAQEEDLSKSFAQEPDISVEPSITESIIRGGAQGATLGFADELTGGAEAALDIAKDPGRFKEFLDLYRQHRNESRGAYKAAEEANPMSYMGGSLASALIPGGAALKLGKGLAGAVKAGIAGGGLVGLGSSESDLTTADPSQAVEATKDAGAGMLVGGLTGGALHSAGALGKEIMDSRYVQDLLAARRFGKAGEKLFGEAAQKRVGKEVTDFAESTTQKLGSEEQRLKDLYSEYLEKYRGKEIEPQNLLNKISNEVEGVQSTLPEVQGQRAKFLDSLEQTGEINPNVGDYEKLMTLRQDLGKLGYDAPLDPRVEAVARQAQGDVSNLLKTNIPGQGALDDQFSALKRSQEILNLSGDVTDEFANVKKLIPLPERMSQEKPFTQAVYDKTLENLRKVNPNLAEEVDNSLEPLAQKLRIVRSMTPSETPSISKMVLGSSRGTANTMGLIENQLPLISSMLENAGYKPLAELAKKATQDTASKNALVFTMAQNPELRQMFKGMVPELDTEKAK